MIKTLIAADRSERERFRIPRSVQQSIPIQKIYRDGIWQTGGKFSRTWRFADINYALASHEDQRDMFTAYCGALNSLPTDATTKITINNRRLNGADFQRSVLMRERGDSLDSYRREYNRVLTDKAAESNDLIQDKYITVSVARKNMDEARTFFHRVDADLSKNFGRLESGGEGRIPTLPDWRNEVKRQPEREAQELALASELFVEGSLNMFAHETNFDIDNRIVCFDLYEMGEQLKPTALNVVLETIQNRVAANRLAGRYTWVFVDEVYLFFKYYYSAQFLYKCWKRFRKYAAAMTAATQNIEECLRSETARLMLANSEFLILLNQAATDRAELAKLLHISETQMSHVTNVEAGHGLMRIGSSIIPFVNEFPRDGTLYRLMTTTPGDK